MELKHVSDLVELLVQAGLSQTAALMVGVLMFLMVAGLYGMRKSWARLVDLPLELKLRAGNCRVKFKRKPSAPRSR